MTLRQLCIGPALFLMAASGPVAGQQDPKELTWLGMEFPPFFIAEGVDADKGIADEMVRMLRGKMPDWKHRSETASTAEIQLRLRAGEQVCSPAYIRTPEREQFMAFSLPDLARFGDGGPASLAALLKDSSLRLGVAKGRSYGEAIDAILLQHKQAKHVYSRFGDDIYASLFELLNRQGVDYILGYPYEAAFHARSRNLEASFVSLPLQESPAMIEAHVACPRTPWGASVIAAIDAALRDLRGTAEHRALVERWIGPELRSDYRRAYEATFGAR
jgi:hypothetical protein